MTNNKTFKSLSGSVLRVTLPNGGVALIGNEWTELPPQFHQGAYVAGAISNDMLQNVAADVVDAGLVNSLTKVATKDSDIRTTILSWIENNEEDHFTRRGDTYTPKVVDLTAAIGSRVFKEERDEIWYKILEEGIEIDFDSED